MIAQEIITIALSRVVVVKYFFINWSWQAVLLFILDWINSMRLANIEFASFCSWCQGVAIQRSPHRVPFVCIWVFIASLEGLFQSKYLCDELMIWCGRWSEPASHKGMHIWTEVLRYLSCWQHLFYHNRHCQDLSLAMSTENRTGIVLVIGCKVLWIVSVLTV